MAVVEGGTGSALRGEGASPVSLAASLIVPVYNEGAALGRCLRALANMATAKAYEIIVVDDGSTGHTARVAEAFGATVICHGKRLGAAAARNTGARQSRGEVLLFIDADCEATLTWLEAMLRPLADPTVSAAYGAYKTRQKELVARFAQAEFEERYARLLSRERIDFLAAHAAAIRRQVFEEVGGFRVDLMGNEDVELGYRLSRRGSAVVFVPEGIVYHEHPSTLARYLRIKVSRGYWRTIVYAKYPRKALSDDYTPPWLKLQTAGLAIVPVALAIVTLWPQLAPVLLLLVAGLLATAVPLTRFVHRLDPSLTPLVPWLSLARSGALALGVLVGVVVVGCARFRGALGRLGEV